MSKYIPGNQKHLTLDDRKYIEHTLNEGRSFKDIARFLCKDPTRFPKRLNYIALVTGTIKVHFTMPTTSVRKDIIVKKQMSVARLFSAT